MNRLVLRFATPLTVAVLVLFAWVVAQRVARGVGEVVPLALTAAVVLALGTPLFLLLWPRMTVSGFRRAILRHGLGGGPIPVNTLRAESAAEGTDLLRTGTDDLLYLAGWLDLRQGPQVLHLPEATGRYCGVQLTDPWTGATFATLGTRTTGGGAVDVVLTPPSWRGTVPAGVMRIRAPHRTALMIGRVFVADAADRAAASAIAERIRLRPLPR